MDRIFFSVFWLVCLGLFGPGCAGPRIEHDLLTPAAAPFSAAGDAARPDQFWTAFNDPQLNQHVARALQGNFDLGAALQRLRAARALTQREASDLWPDLNGVLRQTGDFGPNTDDGRLTVGLDASWQVDLWGQIRSRVDARRFREEATEADYQAVSLALAAEVARTWFALIEARAQLKLLDEQINNNRTGAAFQKKRFEVGQADSADVFRQDQLVQSTLEQAVVVRAQVEILEHLLAVLRGDMPQTASYESGTDLPDLPPMPGAGLPSELLQRRPDVRREFLSFAAADRDLATAITNRYPRVDLSGSLLNVAENPETVFRDWFLSIGAQLIAPILDGGERQAEIQRTNAVVHQRFSEYRQTILIAFQEVEDSLARERYQLERIERLNEQVTLARRASERLQSQSAIGEVNYLDVLNANQAQQRLQRETISARLDLILIRISLYLSLAGGFDVNENLPDPNAMNESPQTPPGNEQPAPSNEIMLNPIPDPIPNPTPNSIPVSSDSGRSSAARLSLVPPAEIDIP